MSPLVFLSPPKPLRTVRRIAFATSIISAIGLIGLSSLKAQQPAPASLGRAPTEWKGVDFVISKIVRLDATHVLVAVRIQANADADFVTFIGILPPGGIKIPKNAKPADIDAANLRPDDFTLIPSSFVDQITGTEYKAENGLPSKPYFGPNGIMANLQSNNWIQLAVRFTAPPPLSADSDGKYPTQKVTFKFPKAKEPIKDVELPPLPPS